MVVPHKQLLATGKSKISTLCEPHIFGYRLVFSPISFTLRPAEALADALRYRYDVLGASRVRRFVVRCMGMVRHCTLVGVGAGIDGRALCRLLFALHVWLRRAQARRQASRARRDALHRASQLRVFNLMRRCRLFGHPIDYLLVEGEMLQRPGATARSQLLAGD